MQFSRIPNLFERHPNTIFRKIKGKSIVLNYKTEKFIELNETGYFIWKKLPSQPQQIINDLAQASKRPKEEIKKDVLNFLESLKRNNFVIKNKRIPLVKAINELTLREKIKAIGMK
jgi:NAD-specific glutamate dehydrogenase